MKAFSLKIFNPVHEKLPDYKLKADYLDVYEGMYAEVISTDRFDEVTYLSTTYLGQVNMTRDTEVKAEESFL